MLRRNDSHDLLPYYLLTTLFLLLQYEIFLLFLILQNITVHYEKLYARPSPRLASLPDASCASRLSFTPRPPVRDDLRPVVRACLFAHRSALKNFSGRFPRTRRPLFRHPFDSCTQISAGISTAFKAPRREAPRALRPDTVRIFPKDATHNSRVWLRLCPRCVP